MADHGPDEFEISIFVPGDDNAQILPPDPSVEHHSDGGWPSAIWRIAKVRAPMVEEQWSRTIDTLMKLSSTITARSTDWSIDEIEVGLTLSAQGELLFIAQAGAEASIKFTLKRKDT